MRAAWGAHTATDDDSPPGTAMCLAAGALQLAAAGSAERLPAQAQFIVLVGLPLNAVLG